MSEVTSGEIGNFEVRRMKCPERATQKVKRRGQRTNFKKAERRSAKAGPSTLDAVSLTDGLPK